ncbi:hypothetical protein LSUB1_G001764 [Lachnellula subtilissima]|uniref:MARVEL domain-containing protein n=1 Tax=Lachnellula subtilissima TaxID=602034 RepID=A0A8H8UDW0_9HELO|nr:hypothetical protein LSUB1_G001764 [Lachnellula subtilissima]
MGIGSQVISVIFRLFELIAGSVVAGMVGEYLHYVSEAHDSPSHDMVYTVAIAGISIVVSLVCMPPLKYAFYGFLLDAALFICWMVAFGLLVNLKGGVGCESDWCYSNWGYYWGGYYNYYPVSSVTAQGVGNSACGKLRAAIAWNFIGGWFWLLSALLGLYVVLRFRNEKKKNASLDQPGNHTIEVGNSKQSGEMSSLGKEYTGATDASTTVAHL